MNFYFRFAQGSKYGDLLDKLLDRYLQCCVPRRGRAGYSAVIVTRSCEARFYLSICDLSRGLLGQKFCDR